MAGLGQLDTEQYGTFGEDMTGKVQEFLFGEDFEDLGDSGGSPLGWIQRVLEPENSSNLCALLDDAKLSEIGAKVVHDFDLDKTSRTEWEALMERAMKLAKQVVEEKSFPWPLASNVKYPLLTTAAIQFAARAYPEICKPGDIVKAKVIGYDADGSKAQRADRVSRHMSWQCEEEMSEWETETDKLLHVLPIMGVCFRKTYFDPLLGRNCSDLVMPDDLVVHYFAQTLEKARRATHVLKYHANDCYELIQAGLWRDIELGYAAIDEENQMGDQDAPHEFLEQHRYLDLDEDGYQEPYIVTVHKATSQTVRIVPRFERAGVFVGNNGKVGKIEPIHYFTKYSFIPNPDGSFYDLGFGWLLGAIGETINTTVNQLIDAGTLGNLGGGFISRGIRIKAQSQTIAIKPGEWKPVDATGQDLRQGIFPVPAPNPSPVLFNLLSLLIDAAKDISSVKDVMTGEQPGANVPATTTLAMVEQGLKVFSGIYKRIYRSLKAEFKKLYRLNGVYLPDQAMFAVLDTPQATGRQDYAQGDLDIVPVADPSMSTDVLRLTKAQALMSASGRPGVNEDALTAEYLQAIRVENLERFIIPPDQRPQPPPDPKMLEVQDKIAHDQAQFQLDVQKTELEMELLRAQIEQTRSTAIKNVAQAEAMELGQQLEQYRLFVDQLNQKVSAQTDILREIIKGQYGKQRANAGQPGGVSGMEGAPSDTGIDAGAEGLQAGILGGADAGINPSGTV
jgi:chaperonin GroES